MPTFARIKHDVRPRANGLSIYPETVPLQNDPKGTGKGTLIPYPENWETWTYRLNSPEGGNWLFSVGSMLFNRDYVDTPLAESITNAGNVVSITSITATHARLQTYKNNLSVPSDEISFENRPHLIHKVVCIKGSTLQLYNPSSGLDIYFPLLSKEGYDLWIPLERLELFPELPFIIRPIDNILSHASPSFDGRIVREYFPNIAFRIYEYRVNGCDVWGQIMPGEWVCLQKGNAFFTNWRMSTRTPIPPI